MRRVNRHNASLDFRYLPNPRLTIALAASYVRSDSLAGQATFLLAPAGASAAPSSAPGEDLDSAAK